MNAYSRANGNPAFEVRYRFLTAAQGGRKTPPRQHLRLDWMYEGDDPHVQGISMIWPEFVDSSGAVLPEGEIPAEGRALMFIANPDHRAFHRKRISDNPRGFMMEGSQKVAECEVVSILGLAEGSHAGEIA